MHSKKLEEVYSELDSSKNGLAMEEANARLKKFGANELKKTKRTSLIKRFFKQFLNVMVGILLVSAVVSIVVAFSKKEYSDLFEGFVILFIVIMNAIIGVIQENKAEACLKELEKYDKKTVKVLRSNVVVKLDSSLLVPGDVIFLEAGDVVCADVRLISSNDFACDESMLTGESVPVEKDAKHRCRQETTLAERTNMAFSGSMVTRGKATGIVVKTGQATEIGHIAQMLFKTKKEQTPLQKSIDKIGKIITWTVLAVCFIILLAEIIVGNNIVNAIMVSVSLAVAAIPESLPAVITIILALGVQQLAKRKCVIKHLHAVETLGSCEVICTDKTGTLTMNKMKVVKSEIFDETEIYNCMAICNNAKFNGKLVEGEPTETALLEFTRDKNITKPKFIHEIPFSSARKMMTVVVNKHGLVSYTKGASEKILNLCDRIYENGNIVPLTEKKRKEIEQTASEFTSRALRVMGFALKRYDNLTGDSDFENNMVFLGLVGLIDPPRLEVKSSIKRCFEAGLRPVMITGDHVKTAFAIASELGIATSEKQVVSGEELDKMSDSQLQKACAKCTVFARVTPEHKVRIVKAFKGLKKIVAMTGDGVNDAPSLKIADIGVGMGKSGTDVVKSVADLVITDDNFSSIVVAVEEGRKVYSNIQKALQFLISTNCVEVFGMLIAMFLFPKYLFLMPVQMLFINLVTDSLPAFALGLEKVEPEVMHSPPRNAKSGLFGGKVGISTIYQAIVQTVLVVAVFAIGIFFFSPEKANTMVFFTMVFMQLIHSVNCKSNETLFGKNIFNNKTFNICFFVTFALNVLVAILPFAHTLLGITALGFSEWLIVIIASIIIVPLCELFKVIISKKSSAE